MLGQSPVDTLISIPPVEITAPLIRQLTPGSSSQYWSADQLNKLPGLSIIDLLSSETGIYLKNYGPGSSATSSIRGGSAGHTLVLWNGLPIQNPMLGLVDLSLFPLQAAESVTFTPGGNTALWGSGAVGGVLNLDNQADFSNKFSIKSTSQVGSFGHWQQHLKIGVGTEKIQSTTHLSHQQATNDFYYFLADGLPERRQTNAQFSQQWLGQDFYWKINTRNRMAVHFWKQNTERQIPPTNVQNRSEARQNDAATRLLLEYRHLFNTGLWQFKTAFFDEHLNYFDDQILLESRSRFRTYLTEITGQWSPRKHHQFLVGNTHTYTHAESAGFQDNNPSEYKTALFVAWKYQRKKLTTQLSLRQEMVGNNVVPIVPAGGLDFSLTPHLILKAKVSRNYRLPTLNDRFWLPGGNPDLLPESGWSQELGLVQNLKRNGFEGYASLTVFNRTINDWILWSPSNGQAYWSANNITNVWSRGVEPRGSISYTAKNIKLQWMGGYDYIRSTNQVALENPRLKAGEQLIYTPVHQAFGTFSVQWKTWYFAYQHRFTGAAQGINDPIKAFQVGHLRLHYSGRMKNCQGTLFFNINNSWDADYLVVERRPMPGIHFQAGLHLYFQKIHSP